MRPIIQGTQKENTDFLALRAIDSCCRISCALDCLPGDCAEQFGELCQEGVTTETASECRDELRMLHWFRTYGLCCYIVGCRDSPGCDKGIHNQWTVEKANRQGTQPSGSDTFERVPQNNNRHTLVCPTRQEGKSGGWESVGGSGTLNGEEINFMVSCQPTAKFRSDIPFRMRT